MMKINDNYDVLVVGGGHAGCEAALAAARMGAKTLMLNLYIDNTAMMPCNPSIGGPAKGHIAREVDALGGEMAAAADFATRHLRWLNTSKGEAVRTLRAQCDPRKYSDWYRLALLNCKNLDLHQAEVSELITENGRAVGVKIKTGQTFRAKTIVLATGTYLGSVIHIGLTCHKSGPLGMVAATEFARSLMSSGLKIGRLRTDTTPRVKIDTIDWDILERQESIEEPQCFSYFGEKKVYSGMFCGLTRTNRKTHDIIRSHFNESPLVSGSLGRQKGPRYCPSIDDKIIKFPEKDSHPIFLEPIAPENMEVYVQNFSTSMCLEAQFESLRTIKGCEHAHILKPGYAIEYDFVPPLQTEPWLETKVIKGLFLAGQINGTSGYEEAGVQGILAGANAVLSIRGDDPLVLRRDQAYAGVMVDDLVTKGTSEPYRMLTSRCEYRLLLRHDNADERLSATGHDLGLLSDEKWNILQARWQAMAREKERISSFKVSPSGEVNDILASAGAAPLKEGTTIVDLLRRPEVTWSVAARLSSSAIDPELGERIATSIKYDGYINREMKEVEKFRRMEQLRFPDDFNFSGVTGLSAEGMQKLSAIKPHTLGQASRISGVPPADIQLLWVAVESRHRKKTSQK